MKLSSEALAELLAGTEGVTPGPWKHRRYRLKPTINEVEGSRKPAVVPWPGFDDSSRPEREHAKNAAHIARCDPDTIRSLVTELIAYRNRESSRG